MCAGEAGLQVENGKWRGRKAAANVPGQATELARDWLSSNAACNGRLTIVVIRLRPMVGDTDGILFVCIWLRCNVSVALNPDRPADIDQHPSPCPTAYHHD
jgi:hypothetical protein